MTQHRNEHINGSYKGHPYSMQLKYAQLYDNGHLIEEVLTQARLTVDGQVITLQTPGFKDVKGNPELALKNYIDYLVVEKKA